MQAVFAFDLLSLRGLARQTATPQKAGIRRPISGICVSRAPVIYARHGTPTALFRTDQRRHVALLTMRVAARGRIFHVAPEDTFTIGQVRGRFDIAFELEHAYAFEAQVLVDPTAAPATDVQTDTESTRNHDAPVAVSIARAGGTSLKPELSQAGEAKFRFNALHSREVRWTSAWILLAPGVVAFAAVLAAVFITIHGHQEASTIQPAAIERGRAADIRARS